jgi:hypothetical protein
LKQLPTHAFVCCVMEDVPTGSAGNVARLRQKYGRARPAWNFSTEPEFRGETGLLSDNDSYLLAANMTSSDTKLTQSTRQHICEKSSPVRRIGKLQSSRSQGDALVVKDWPTHVNMVGQLTKSKQRKKTRSRRKSAKTGASAQVRLGEESSAVRRGFCTSTGWQDVSNTAKEDQHELSKQLWALFSGECSSSVLFLYPLSLICRSSHASRGHADCQRKATSYQGKLCRCKASTRHHHVQVIPSQQRPAPLLPTAVEEQYGDG